VRKLHNKFSSTITPPYCNFLFPSNKKADKMTENRINFRQISCILAFIAFGILAAIPPSVGETVAPDIVNVTLWKYNIDVRANYDNFWTATNPSRYIIPDNPIIQYYANHTDEIQIDYRPDATDYWQNPDYTLKIMKGDCEDSSLIMVSIHRAKGHEAIAVGGELYFDDGTVIRDMWYEYINNGTRQVKFVTPVVNNRHFTFRPMFMFNEKMSIRDYDKNWMKK
jgi:hypothetical protein